MATKKTSPEAKKSTSAEGLPDAGSRPTAPCPLPRELQVDLESAETEWMRYRHPADAPQLVFSTRSLEHGTKAWGAAGLRKGFAWNEPMDLAWALGYPAMAFLVDGVPDSKDAILAFLGKNAKDAKDQAWFSTIVGSRRILPRRAAFALLFELEHGKNPMHLEEKEFLEASEPRILPDSEVKNLMRKTKAHNVEDVALVIEAVAGSVVVAESLCEALVEHASNDGDNGKLRASVNTCFMPILRRLPEGTAAALIEKGAPDARQRGMEAFARGSALALARLQWVDAAENEMRQAFLTHAKKGVGDVPFSRYLYAGGEELLAEQVKIFDKYTDGPIKFFEEYSTIRHPLLVGPALLARANKLYREGMTKWFERHAEFHRPLLAGMAKDSKYGKLAAALAKDLG